MASVAALGNVSCTLCAVDRGIIPGVEKIAVLRANGLGDFVFALPALDSLRAAYPAAEIVLLAKSWHREFLEGRPSPVDRVEVVPPYRGVGLPDDVDVSDREDEVENFFRLMQRKHFDLAIQLHGGGGNSNRFLNSLGARVTAGSRAPGAEHLDLEVPYLFFQLEPIRYLEVVSLVGGIFGSLEPHIQVIDRDIAEAQRLVPEMEREPYAVIHPGVSKVDRRWPTQKFAQVADALAAKGLQVILTGDESERTLTQSVSEHMNRPSMDLAGRLSVGGLAGLLSRAAVTVSNDTGPLHLAEAVGTPTVGVYWCFNMITSSAATRTWHRQLVSWRLNCPVCGASQITNPCGHPVSYVTDVPVSDVLEHAEELVERRLGTSSSGAQQSLDPVLAR